MNIPQEVLQWISLHRTHLDQNNLGQAYKNSLADDYRMMLPLLPERCEHILDIGCGMAGIDIFLYFNYRKNVHLNLIDGTGNAEIKFGFNRTLEPYNHLSITKNFLLANQVDNKHLHFHPIDPELTIPCDLLISLMSWGFHYPADTYCALAKRSLNSGGILILDIRTGTNYDCFKNSFTPVAKIYTREGKFDRMVFRAH